MTASYKTKEIVIFGILTAIVLAGQVALVFLPNIEIVTLLFILYTLVLGRKVFYIIYVFALVQGLIYGFGMWWINYMYVWSVQAIITLIFSRQTSVMFWGILSGFYGISFGALCSIPYFFAGGPSAAFAYWVAGIPYDITHCIANLVICVVLYTPLRYILEQCVKESNMVMIRHS
ncbi:MAG: hypothetical protein IKV59_01260 [Lachnospiraceae bacterium]|nr:hypothetical protein [Lachnospiraceae bacterium]